MSASNLLRNDAINYSDGWFFVTAQVAQNKTMFGVIAAGGCALNELGRRVGSCWEGVFEHHPEAYRDAFIVMPNHFHAVIRIHPRPDNKPNHLSYLLQGFKSFTTHVYHGLARAGQCPDIGTRLWQKSFYDNLITSHEELENIRAYIRNNPARWDNDRFGPVTTHHCGNIELLNQPLVAYVASEQDTAVLPYDTASCAPSAPPSRGAAPPEQDTAVLPYDTASCAPSAPPSRGAAPPEQDTAVLPYDTASCAPSAPPSRGAAPPSRGAGPPCPVPVISTFTSAQERRVLARCLAMRRPFIHVMPGGIPPVQPSATARACAEGWGLVLSPSAPGTGLNKQRAIWCNQYVLNQAASVLHGSIRPGGTLETLLRLRQRHPSGMEPPLGSPAP